MTALDWTLFGMFMVALFIAWFESNKKLEYWRLWTKVVEQREDLHKELKQLQEAVIKSCLDCKERDADRYACEVCRFDMPRTIVEEWQDSQIDEEDEGETDD